MEQNDLFWNLYLSEREFARHHENQRTTASNILAAIAAGLIVGFGSAIADGRVQIAISSMLMVLGLFGYFFCGKLTALIKLHNTRSYEYLKMLDETVGHNKVSEVKKKAEVENKKSYGLFHTLSLSSIWTYFHLFIFFVGLMFFLFKIDPFIPQIKQLLDLSRFA